LTQGRTKTGQGFFSPSINNGLATLWKRSFLHFEKRLFKLEHCLFFVVGGRMHIEKLTGLNL